MRESEHILGTPIVFERPKKKKKKGRKSKSLRDVHAMERHLSKAMHRTARAADEGMATYRKASKVGAEVEGWDDCLFFTKCGGRGNGRYPKNGRHSA